MKNLKKNNKRLDDILYRKRPNKPRQLLLFKEKNFAYRALMFFKDTHKTEEAFYLRFQTMPADFRKSLMKFYHVDDNFKLFKFICKWWNIYEKKSKIQATA